MRGGKGAQDGHRLPPPVVWWVLLTLGAIFAATAATLALLRLFGLEAVLVLFVAGSAAVWGWVVRWLWKDGRMTVSHLLVIWMVWTGTVLSGASYYLAYRGLTSDLETLSRYIMVEVVAGVGGYFAKAAVENMAAKRKTPDKGVRDL